MWIRRKSLGRARLSGTCPTLTPGSAILVGESGRLMVHLVPVHKLVLPADLSDTEFGNFGAKGRWAIFAVRVKLSGSLSFMLRVEGCLYGCVFTLGARMCKDSWRNHCYPNERATQNLNRASVRIFGNVI